MDIDQNYIDYFEKCLDPVKPENSELPFEILGYGEISSIFRMEKYNDIAFKRLPVFPDRESAESYRNQYFEYTGHLEKAGINLPEDDIFITHVPGRPYILYVAQQLFSPDSFCSRQISIFSEAQIVEMLEKVIDAIKRVQVYNEKSMPGIEIAVDAQLSNWTWPVENGKRKLYLIDTSTPFYRIQGHEQLDVKLLLKSMPFIIRLFISLINLDEVVARYYDLRIVFIDIIGNLIKEQSSDLIPLFIDIVNKTLEEDFKIEPVSKKEVESYYQNDKRIWMAFSTLRRVDRFMTGKILGKRYEFLLPGKVKR
ncbi:MAG: hypothetical protein B6230_00665 [Desulfobacteraceae bacterium 4572_89]|nr:MAG: hypothetical protein B6230_00665 [Desulfobacteraceae bacterium 4572_89]